jgi:hypothetical protein
VKAARTRKRGRPSTGAISIHLRIAPRELAALDKFRADQEGNLSRPEVVRLFVHGGLIDAGYLPVEEEGAEVKELDRELNFVRQVVEASGSKSRDELRTFIRALISEYLQALSAEIGSNDEKRWTFIQALRDRVRSAIDTHESPTAKEALYDAAELINDLRPTGA